MWWSKCCGDKSNVSESVNLDAELDDVHLGPKQTKCLSQDVSIDTDFSCKSPSSSALASTTANCEPALDLQVSVPHDTDALQSPTDKQQSSPLSQAREQRGNAGTVNELFLVSQEIWETESAILPSESQPLSGVYYKLMSDVLALLNIWEKEPGAKPKDALHPTTLVAFLRAYDVEDDFPNPEKTAKLLREALEERKAHILAPPLEPEQFAQCRAIWPRCVSGFDRQGHCILWDGATEMTAKRCQATFGSLVEAVVQLSHYDRTFWKEMDLLKRNCTEQYGILMYRHIAVIDLKKSDYNSILNPGFLDGVRKLIGQCAGLYPDTLRHMYLVNANWLARTGWSVVKRFIHPATLARISVLGSDWMATFETDTGLTRSEIPSSYGGSAENLQELPMICPVPASSPMLAGVVARCCEIDGLQDTGHCSVVEY